MLLDKLWLIIKMERKSNLRTINSLNAKPEKGNMKENAGWIGKETFKKQKPENAAANERNLQRLEAKTSEYQGELNIYNL